MVCLVLFSRVGLRRGLDKALASDDYWPAHLFLGLVRVEECANLLGLESAQSVVWSI